MIYYHNGQWSLCEEQVHYTQHDREITQYVGLEGHDWWVEFAERWEHTDIIEFIPVEPTAEQLERFAEIQQLNLPEGHNGIVSDYVSFGAFPEGVTHPLRSLQVDKQIASTRSALRSLVRVDELTTDELTAIIDLYEPYEVSRAYDYPDVVRYEGKLYQVREGQAHTSQADWSPPETPALYRALMPDNVIGEYDPDRNLAANPFLPGEKMIWTDGKVYESIHPSPHAWTPADYPAAWRLVE